jgi:hypothetical protein
VSSLHWANGTVALADGDGRETGAAMSPGTSLAFASFQFPREVISAAIGWGQQARELSERPAAAPDNSFLLPCGVPEVCLACELQR